MVRRSAFFLPMVSVSLALCLLSFTSPVHATKPNRANPHAMGTQVDCRGGKSCASWLTINFASKGALAAIAGNGLSIARISQPLGRRSDRMAGAVADNDNGHGNDLGHVDGSNPGNSSNNQNGANAESGNRNPPDDNGHGNDVGKTDSSNPGQGGGPAAGSDSGNGNGGGNSKGNGGGNDGQHDDNGHGNDPGRTDGSNPGKGK